MSADETTTKNEEPETETMLIETVDETGPDNDGAVNANQPEIPMFLVEEGDAITSTGLSDVTDLIGVDGKDADDEPVTPVKDPSLKDKKAQLNGRSTAKTRNHDPLSFDALRKEHDLMLIMRSVLIIVASIILMIPMPVSFLCVKFMIFILLAYASIYNERMIGEEAAIRQDKHSRIAHIVSYIAFILTIVFFFFLALNTGIAYTNMQNALTDAQARLIASGLPAPVVK